jgi:DNA-binding IclR family transcriptional regulator
MRRSPIKSATRVLEVLELFAELRLPLRQKNVVERLGYPQSSTTGLLKSLVATGYLNYHRASHTYFPTTRVAAVGDWINHFMYGSGAVLEMMTTLAEQTQETVALVSQNDLFIQYLRVIAPDHPHKFPPPEGTMRLLTQSSAGLVLLSRMQDRTVTRLVRHIDILEGRGKRADLPQLIDQLHWVRREGFCFLAGIPVPEAATISMPLPDAPHGIPLAIGVGGANARITRNRSRIVDTMRAAVDAYRGAIAAVSPSAPPEDLVPKSPP